MHITGEYLFEGVDQQAVWNMLMNPDILAKVIPGVRQLLPHESEAFTWHVAALPGFAALLGVDSGMICLRAMTPVSHYCLTIYSDSPANQLHVNACFELTEIGDKPGTKVQWMAEVTVPDRLLALGSRFVESAVAILSQQFFTAVARRLAPPAGEQ